MAGRTDKVEAITTTRNEHEAQASESTARCRMAGVVDKRRPSPAKTRDAGKAG